MRINIISLFPEMFEGQFSCSMLKKAKESKHIDIEITNPRNFTYDKHKLVDDCPYGGGSGMVMKPEPFFRAVKSILAGSSCNKHRILLMCPAGVPFDQQKAKELSEYEQLIIICGHYEGVDERVRLYLAEDIISIGDYVLTGGELPAMVVADAVVRLLPGVLGASDGAEQDSFYNGLLEHPHYTRPREFNGWTVPDILVSGDHAKITLWRKEQSLKNTLLRRPELLDKIQLAKKDLQLLQKIKLELKGKV